MTIHSGLESLTKKEALLPLMAKVINELAATLNKDFRDQGIDLTKDQAVVLRLLSIEDGRPQQDLALITARDKSSLTRLLTTLESKHFIRRTVSRRDRRVNLVHITPAGLHIYRQAEPIMINLLNKATRHLSKEDIESTKELVLNILQNISTQS